MAIISEDNLEEFKAYILEGKTILELQEIYSCSKTTITSAKKRFNLVGLTPNDIVRDITKTNKLCLSCGNEKPLSEFYSNGYSSTGKKKYKPKCKLCDGAFTLTRLRSIFEKYLNSVGREYKCETCGYNKNYSAIEFHHKDSTTKDFNLSDISRSSSEKVILEKLANELPKCDILCANCHREVHHPNSMKL